MAEAGWGMIRVVAWQKPTQYSKTIIIQLKINLKNKHEKIKILEENTVDIIYNLGVERTFLSMSQTQNNMPLKWIIWKEWINS